jgi:hypothetical protein
MNFFFGIHDKGSVLRHGFLDRFALHPQEFSWSARIFRQFQFDVFCGWLLHSDGLYL